MKTSQWCFMTNPGEVERDCDEVGVEAKLSLLAPPTRTAAVLLPNCKTDYTVAARVRARLSLPTPRSRTRSTDLLCLKSFRRIGLPVLRCWLCGSCSGAQVASTATRRSRFGARWTRRRGSRTLRLYAGCARGWRIHLGGTRLRRSVTVCTDYGRVASVTP